MAEEGTARIVLEMDDADVKRAEREAIASQRAIAREAEKRLKSEEKAQQALAREAAKRARDAERVNAEIARAAERANAAMVREAQRANAAIAREAEKRLKAEEGAQRDALKQQMFLLRVREKSEKDYARQVATNHRERIAQIRAEQQAFATGVGGVGAAVAGVAALTKALVDQENALSDYATRTGLARDTLAGLQRAAEGSGQDLSALATPLGQLGKRIADFHAGTGEAKRALEAMGLTAQDLPLDDLDGSLRLVLDRIGALPTAAERSAAAVQIFGEAGGAMAQAGLLAAGALDQYTAAAVASGAANEDAAASAAQLQQDIANVGLAARGAGSDLLAAFGPELHTVLRNATALLKAGVAGAMENVRDQIEAARASLALLGSLGSGDLDTVRAAAARAGAALSDAVDVRDDIRAAADAGAEWMRATEGLGDAAAATGPTLTDYAGRVARVAGASKTAADETDRLRVSLTAEARAYVELLDPTLAYQRALDDIARSEVDAETAAILRLKALDELTAAQEAIQERSRSAKEAEARAYEEYERAKTRALEEEAAKRAARQEAEWAAFQTGTADLLRGLADLGAGVTERRTEAVEELTRTLTDSTEELSAAERAALQKRLDAEKAALEKAWERQQAAAMALALLDAAQGISRAAASVPPPLNIPVIAAAAATGAANVAAIAAAEAPAFDDTPGPVQAVGTGRAAATFKSGDVVVAAQDPADVLAQALTLAGIGGPAGGPRPRTANMVQRVRIESLSDEVAALLAPSDTFGAFGFTWSRPRRPGSRGRAR